MPAAGSNAIEFRIVQTLHPNGQVIGERWQVRTKNVTALVLGLIPLASNWSEWQEINVEVIQETTQP